MIKPAHVPRPEPELYWVPIEALHVCEDKGVQATSTSRTYPTEQHVRQQWISQSKLSSYWPK
eukprot:579484-Prorocentrum_lima.AAC.1